MSKGDNNMKTTALIPIKLNSERLPMKNIKPFQNGKPLLFYILDTVVHTEGIDEIYVYCSNEEIIKYLPEKVQFLKRDPYYDLSTTKFNEVLSSFAELVPSDIYLLTHATAPFITANSIAKGLNAVKSGQYDSAFSVNILQEFLWKDGKPFNYSIDNIPRTQDLEKIYSETCGLYIYTKDLILNHGRRIGNHPYFIELSKIESCDINNEEDFIIADAIYNSIVRERRK